MPSKTLMLDKAITNYDLIALITLSFIKNIYYEFIQFALTLLNLDMLITASAINPSVGST